jgi:hypothetical protein
VYYDTKEEEIASDSCQTTGISEAELQKPSHFKAVLALFQDKKC